LARLSVQAKRSGLRIIAHAPAFELFDANLRRRIFAALRILYSESVDWKERSVVVWHADPARSIEENRWIQKEILNHGFQSAPENYLLSNVIDHVNKAVRDLADLWQEPSCLPVLDLARFYLIQDAGSALEWSLAAIHAAGLRRTLLLHMTDSHTAITDRKNWCPPGAGIVAWDRILRGISACNSDLGIILEYEDRRNPLEARDWILKQLSRGNSFCE
jgi:sugar phosphate isomerase/epimerase